MAAAIRHRGPDGYGFYSGRKVGLTNVRLGVSDPGGAGQPLVNEDGQFVVTSSSDIFNHPELRQELEARGHVFRTRCQAEILVHGYEEWGAELLQRLDGQFAFAIYDRARQEVFVARDRFGVRPLFYAQRNGDFFFGSEIKAILATAEVDAALDCRGLDEVFQFGAARAPRTGFSGIAALEPGTYGIWNDGALWLRRYYELDYPELEEEPVDVVEQLDEIILRSVGLRLRADVAVGAFLNGGLGSSIVAFLARKPSATKLRTFSVSRDNDDGQSKRYYEQAAAAVGGAHTAAGVTSSAVAHSFPDVVWHSETPILGAEPALGFQLAKLTKESGIKAVVSGDGADELFLGNDVFKETSVRRFCLRRPESRIRPLLFKRVYVPGSPRARLDDSTVAGLLTHADLADPLFSHLPRFGVARLQSLYSADFKSELGALDVVGELRASLPTRFFGWSDLNRAAYLQMTTALSPHLLSCHDRMMMAHGVQGRYPFLDHRVFEFAAALPTSSRLRGLRGKEVLARWASRVLPRPLSRDREMTNTVSDAEGFLTRNAPSWIEDRLSTEALKRTAIFAEQRVQSLVQRCRATPTASAADSQAFIGVLSTQLWHEQFVENTMFIAPLSVSGASVLLSDNASLVPTAHLSDS